MKSIRANRLLSDLMTARNDGLWVKLLTEMMKPDLLILDDSGLSPFDTLHCRDLLKIADDRYGRG